MFKKILVPLEGSALAECALPHAKAIAQAVGAQLLLLHVVEQVDGDRAPQVNPLDWYLQKAEAQSYISQISHEWQQSNLSVSHALVEGPAAARVVEYAHVHDVDLVVLSNQSQSGVAQKVIWQVGKSVMLVRAEWPTATPDEMHYGRILISLDGSLRAESVLPLATRLAQHHQADLLLAHIVARPDMVNRHTPTPEDSALIEQITGRNLAAATGYLAQLQQRLPLETQTRLLVSDNVIASLHDLIEQEKVDLLILSAHGHSGGSQRPFGNLATNFIIYGLVPLLIVQDMPSLKTGLSSQSVGQRVGHSVGQGVGHSVGGQTVANANYAH